MTTENPQEKATEKPQSNNVRTSVSLHKKVGQWADEMMEARGFDNFSAYVADLIRRDKEGEAAKSSTDPRAKSVFAKESAKRQKLGESRH